MAEIKSTLELALERTQRLSMTQQERETLRQKVILEKASRLFHRYIEGYVTWSEIVKEIERTDENLKVTVRGELLSQLTGALTLDSSVDEQEKVLAGIEALTGRGQDAFRGRFQGLAARHRKAGERVREQVRIQLLEELKSEGITGSAVEPRNEASPLYEREMRAVRDRDSLELIELKKELTS